MSSQNNESPPLTLVLTRGATVKSKDFWRGEDMANWFEYETKTQIKGAEVIEDRAKKSQKAKQAKEKKQETETKGKKKKK